MANSSGQRPACRRALSAANPPGEGCGRQDCLSYFREALPFTRESALSISAAADKYYSRLGAEQEFDTLAANLLGRLRKEITRRQKLQTNLRNDLIAHGQPEEHKRLGDLLLANIANAKRSGNRVSLIDYYAEGAPTMEVELDENTSLPAAAGEYFSRYAKAKRAVAEIGARLLQLDRELEDLGKRQTQLEKAIASRDLVALARI